MNGPTAKEKCLQNLDLSWKIHENNFGPKHVEREREREDGN